MMSKLFDVLYLFVMSALLLTLLGQAYVTFEESKWRDKCKDAGGYPAGHFVCVNPGAVIEVI